jgi:hypothetical protein
MVLQRVQGLFLPKEESEVRQLVLDACERFGSELLASESLDDLDDRLDALLYSDAFQSVNAALLAYAFNNPRRLRRLAAEAGTEPIGLGRLFADKGLPAAKMVWEGDLLDREVLLALRPLLIAVGDEGAQAIAEESVKLEPLGFLYDASFPPEVSAGLLGSLRASACLLALGAILTRPDRVEPWLAQGLATRRREGLLAYLRTLASNPGSRCHKGSCRRRTVSTGRRCTSATWKGGGASRTCSPAIRCPSIPSWSDAPVPVLGEWGWFDTSAHTAGGKTRVGIVVGIAGDQILVAVGTSTDRGPPRHTVLEGGRLGRRLGLRNPTHFYPYGFLKLPRRR